MSKCQAWAAVSPTSPLAPFTFERREPNSNDVVIDIQYCGVCHSDIHTARDEWPGQKYPVVPGHEIVGRVREVGADVRKFSVGDLVGVGCMVDSCLNCDECNQGLEQYCRNDAVWTYGTEVGGELTQGGYSDHIVVREEFVVPFPEELDTASAAPLLCAGVTTYSPLRHYKVGPGSKVGVAGFGGLGAMAVKLAKSMGAHVTVISRSLEKENEAKKAGADEVISLSDVKKHKRSLDIIISTVPKTHDITPYITLLNLDGVYVIVGAIEKMNDPYDSGDVINKRAIVTGSGIGGIKETEEMLAYCNENNIVSDVEIVPIQKINEVYDTVSAGKVGHRYVIDMSTIEKSS